MENKLVLEEPVINVDSVDEESIKLANDITTTTNLISNLIKDEWEAIDGYNQAIVTFAANENNENIIKVFEDIISEEYIHIGQLEKIIQGLIPMADESINLGKEEATDEMEPKLELEEPEIEESLTESQSDTTTPNQARARAKSYLKNHPKATKDELAKRQGYNSFDDIEDDEVAIGIESAMKDYGVFEESLDIDSKVTRKFDKDKRVGQVTKHISDDVYEVDFPETDKLPGMSDRYYEDDLENYPDDDIPEDIAANMDFKKKGEEEEIDG